MSIRNRYCLGSEKVGLAPTVMYGRTSSRGHLATATERPLSVPTHNMLEIVGYLAISGLKWAAVKCAEGAKIGPQ